MGGQIADEFVAARRQVQRGPARCAGRDARAGASATRLRRLARLPPSSILASLPTGRVPTIWSWGRGSATMAAEETGVQRVFADSESGPGRAERRLSAPDGPGASLVRHGLRGRDTAARRARRRRIARVPLDCSGHCQRVLMARLMGLDPDSVPARWRTRRRVWTADGRVRRARVGAPGWVLSVARRIASRLMCAMVGGRSLGSLGGWFQWRATRRRCQPITIAGCTST